MTFAILATAYCLAGVTATGTQTHTGTIAVDPRVIRLGAHVYVPGYGEAHAEDTGSAIRGNRIDVWFASCSRARRWGARWLRVIVR